MTPPEKRNPPQKQLTEKKWAEEAIGDFAQCMQTWVGNDDFQSLGDNEFGSTTALPIWVDYMGKAFPSLEPDSNEMPDGISYIRVDKQTGKQTQETGKQTYFDLFFSEDLNYVLFK